MFRIDFMILLLDLDYLIVCFCFDQKDGGKLSRDVWSSRNSEHFYGCSNASSKFPSS